MQIAHTILIFDPSNYDDYYLYDLESNGLDSCFIAYQTSIISTLIRFSLLSLLFPHFNFRLFFLLVRCDLI